MAMKFRFSGTLLRFADYNKEVEIADAKTLSSALDQLIELFPDLRKIVLDSDGSVRGAIKVFLNREQLELRTKSALDRSLQANDEVELLTAIAGG